MKYYFLSDIHGNLPALEIVLKNIDNDSNIIFLGDIVNYGPWSNECVDLIDSLKNKVTLLGNHEDYFINGICCPHDLVHSFFNFCINKFNRFNIISNYKKKYSFLDYTCIHTIDDKKIFYNSDININGNFIIGHSHQQFHKNKNNFNLINPGSVGQNRKNLNIISYCEFNYSQKSFLFHNLEYDSTIVIKKMIEMKYPDICINYYKQMRS
mgnify:FL=1